jgi:hypothetical protein
MMHWQCELFVRSRAGPYGASGGLPTIPLSRRASWTALAWYACALRSSNRPAYRARAWLRRQLPLKCDGDLTGRRPGGWTRRWRYRARSRSRRLGARRRPLAPSHIFCAPLVAAVHWRRELFARPGAGPYGASNGFAGDTRVPARLVDCTGVAWLLIAQVGPAGLSIQARFQHRLLLKGGGDLIGRRPGSWPSWWWHRARSRSQLLGAWRRLLAPAHYWRALLAAVVHWWRELLARPRDGPDIV